MPGYPLFSEESEELTPFRRGLSVACGLGASALGFAVSAVSIKYFMEASMMQPNVEVMKNIAEAQMWASVCGFLGGASMIGVGAELTSVGLATDEN